MDLVLSSVYVWLQKLWTLICLPFIFGCKSYGPCSVFCLYLSAKVMDLDMSSVYIWVQQLWTLFCLLFIFGCKEWTLYCLPFIFGCKSYGPCFVFRLYLGAKVMDLVLSSVYIWVQSYGP